MAPTRAGVHGVSGKFISETLLSVNSVYDLFKINSELQRSLPDTCSSFNHSGGVSIHDSQPYKVLPLWKKLLLEGIKTRALIKIREVDSTKRANKFKSQDIRPIVFTPKCFNSDIQMTK